MQQRAQKKPPTSLGKKKCLQPLKFELIRYAQPMLSAPLPTVPAPQRLFFLFLTKV
ncbi:hypothetical protein L211DRAFT_839239, partial [Terfezia boudieri ATCC MYA-4762]